MESMQKEVKSIRRQFEIRPTTDTSIGKPPSTSIDMQESPLSDIHEIPSTDAKSPPVHEKLEHDKKVMFDSMQEEMKELSEYAYDKLGKHQFHIEQFEESLQILSDEASKMNERWSRVDDTIRSLIATRSRSSRDEVDACYQTSGCSQPH